MKALFTLFMLAHMNMLSVNDVSWAYTLIQLYFNMPDIYATRHTKIYNTWYFPSIYQQVSQSFYCGT